MNLLEEITNAGFYITQEFITAFDVLTLDYFKYLLYDKEYIDYPIYDDVIKKNKLSKDQIKNFEDLTDVTDINRVVIVNYDIWRENTSFTIIFRDQNDKLRTAVLLDWLTPGQVEYYINYPEIAQDLIDNINMRYSAERDEAE